MKNQLIALSAAALLLVACGGDEQSTTEVNVTAPTPGTAADFKANHGDRVFFSFNQSKLSDDAKKILAEQATWLKTYSSTTAVIEGKTDTRGTEEYNLALGEKRANSAKKELVKNGVAENRLQTISYGKTRLEVPGDTPEAHAQNRVAITVVQ